MTYRERREARAERLRGWAEGREARAETANATAQEIADGIPFGQPILVGHHSEARARRDLARIWSNTDRAIADSRKADEMRERADNINRAAAGAIYSDDPDAAEALRAKIDKLDGQRARLKAYNASCRAAAKLDPASTHGDFSLLDDGQRADFLSLAGTCPYQIREYGQFPGYATSNLSGTINATKKRLAALESQPSAEH